MSFLQNGRVLSKCLWQTGSKSSILGSMRSISVSANLRESFKVQDTQDFEERVKKSSIPVVVDFFATWCNPCRMLTPRIESIIEENKGKIKLAKVDIDQNTDLALDYDVSSVPVLLVMRNGQVEQRLVGLQDPDKLRNWVNQAINNPSAKK